MKHLIDKDALVAEINKRLHQLTDAAFDSMIGRNLIEIKDFIDTLEVKELDMPALDNGIMPVERWKEACEAASCQANYRKSKGLTETCDDYFVDGVQWADEHPIKSKDADLNKEIDLVEDKYHGFESLSRADIIEIAKHFFEFGLKARQ